MPRPLVHIIDDDAAVRDALSILLRVHGFLIRTYPSAESFLEADGQSEPGCILTDIQMPGMSGLELLARLGADGPLPPAIVMTGRSERRLAETAARRGARFVDKPFAPDEIVAAVTEALARAT
jgi:FixJ family two-component response regulator